MRQRNNPMIRNTLTLLVGAAIGAAGVFLVSNPSPQLNLAASESSPETAAAPGHSGLPAPGADNAAANAYADHEDRTRFYLAVANADESTLMTKILELTKQPDSPARRFHADVLLARLAELDPGNSIEIARAHGFGQAQTAALYAVWARSDATAALAALSHEPDASIARQAGVLLVQELGSGTTALLDVIDALPPSVDRLMVQIDVVAAMAESDPDTAIAQALAFESTSDRRLAMQRVASKLAKTAPHLALSASEQIIDEASRLGFRNTLMREWSSADPGAVFDYLETTDINGADLQTIMGSSLRALSRFDPERLLAFASNLPAQLGEYARYQAVAEWSKEDPVGALGFVAEQSPGKVRDRMLAGIAKGYSEYDLDAALAWAQSLQPVPRGIYREIISSVAASDVDRAIEIALGMPGEIDKMEAVQSIAMVVTSRPSRAEEIAGRLLAIPDENIQEQSMQMLAAMWSQSDPEAAITWMVANMEQMSDNSIQQMARRIAEQHPQLAAEYTERVPADARDEWIRHVASGYAAYDSEAAMQWLSQYQGQPAYEAAVVMIAQQSAQRDPIAAAKDLENNPDASYATAVAALAGRQWARSDPQSAAAWARRLQNEDARNTAMASVARQWAQTDPESAGRWAMSLPEGESRDGALASAVSGIAARVVPDDTYFEAISSDFTRQQAALTAAYQLVRTDGEAADRLIDKYVTDAAMRNQYQQNRARISLY